MYYYTTKGDLLRVDLVMLLEAANNKQKRIQFTDIVDIKAWGDLACQREPNDVYYFKHLEHDPHLFKNGEKLSENPIVEFIEGYLSSISKQNNSIFLAGFYYPLTAKRKVVNNFLKLMSKKGKLLDSFEYEITNDEDGNNEPVGLISFTKKLTEFCLVYRKMDFLDIFAVHSKKIVPIKIAIPTIVEGEEFSAHKGILVYENDKQGCQIILLKNQCITAFRIDF